MAWREEDHPRDDDGKFTDEKGCYRQNTSYSEIKSRMALIPLTFFEDLSRQSVPQLQKGIKSKQKVIEHHREKIANPKAIYAEWDSFDDRRKANAIAHWEKEIKTHEKEISVREDLIRRLKRK